MDTDEGVKARTPKSETMKKGKKTSTEGNEGNKDEEKRCLFHRDFRCMVPG
jgi:hypothetical protein